MQSKNLGKKITLFLADSEPDGFKIISLGGWNGIGMIFPRNKLKEVKNDPMIQKPGVYFLFGKESQDSPVTLAYIGETENIFDRLTSHNSDKNKDFWYMTVVFTASDDSMTKAHVKYLESRCVQLAYEAKHFGYALEEGKESLRASLPRADVTVMEEFLLNIDLILATIGYPILHKVESKTDINKDNPLFFCQGTGSVKGTARMTNEGFILYKGSTISKNHSRSILERNQKIIAKLLAEKIIKENSDDYIFERDYSFSSPSAAGDLVVGYPVNGWEAWKTQEGKTLDEIYRK